MSCLATSVAFAFNKEVQFWDGENRKRINGIFPNMKRDQRNISAGGCTKTSKPPTHAMI